jgi:hypothetical protein
MALPLPQSMVLGYLRAWHLLSPKRLFSKVAVRRLDSPPREETLALPPPVLLGLPALMGDSSMFMVDHILLCVLLLSFLLDGEQTFPCLKTRVLNATDMSANSNSRISVLIKA